MQKFNIRTHERKIKAKLQDVLQMSKLELKNRFELESLVPSPVIKIMHIPYYIESNSICYCLFYVASEF